MNEMKGEKSKNMRNKGITLIALVITIIVLLILAGVSIATLTGENGILTRAQDSKTQTGVEGEKEEIQLAYAGAVAEKRGTGDITASDLNREFGTNGTNATAEDGTDGEITVTFDPPSNREYTIDANGNISDPTTGEVPPPSEEPGNPDDSGIFQETSTIDGGEATANNPTIPEGFRPMDTDTSSWGDGTSAPSSEDVGNGLVITDAPEGEVGNEFVWIPVENFDEFEREHFGTEAQKWWTGTFVTDGLSDNNFYEPASDGIMDTEVEKMYKSVKENKGFYIGRYEAGTTASSGRGIRGEVVSKKGANVYNYIGFADTDNMTDETGGAVEVARGMYNEEKGDSVTSTLIYGVQWDAIMRWMQDVPNLTGGKYVEDSTGMGWYSDNYSNGNANHQTGIDVDGGKNKVKNIYDLAGNVYEWTMESCYTNYRVIRGGGYGNSGSDSPASYRLYYIPSYSHSGVGFRVTLYL